ncbi:hypothetical protein K504DRAFT_539573 [Pleomassaria siparia CBS 279.74]|uniref:Uncharacterized protein n=1 Tax=Pleomassaria siparia CBS 279.74 TaxID=1314801 RepID=A0A6G1JPB8_9PLEO|nr:hypothetical protein K504DRAFT_539573 [Pleomassaria siparia CBS 279.74]
MTNTPAPRRAPAKQDTPVPCEDKASVTLSKRPASSFGKERTYSPHKKAATAAPDEKDRGSLVPMPGRTKMPVESSSAEGSDEELAGRWGFRDYARRSNAADLAVQHSILVKLQQLN